MVNTMSTFQVPSSYGLGMVKKWHERGNSIDNRESFSIAWGLTRAQRWCKGTKKDFRWLLSASYIPLVNESLFGYFQSFLSSAKIPHFCFNWIYTVICPISDMFHKPVMHHALFQAPCSTPCSTPCSMLYAMLCLMLHTLLHTLLHATSPCSICGRACW